MTSAPHAEGRQFDPGQVYMMRKRTTRTSCRSEHLAHQIGYRHRATRLSDCYDDTSPRTRRGGEARESANPGYPGSWRDSLPTRGFTQST